MCNLTPDEKVQEEMITSVHRFPKVEQRLFLI